MLCILLALIYLLKNMTALYREFGLLDELHLCTFSIFIFFNVSYLFLLRFVFLSVLIMMCADYKFENFRI